MEGLALAKMLAALIFVVSLMFGLGLVLKKMGLAGPQALDQKKRRLKFLEALPLDGKRRLVLVSCDDQQHLLVLGANGETVVERNIPVPDEVDQQNSVIATTSESGNDRKHATKTSKSSSSTLSARRNDAA